MIRDEYRDELITMYHADALDRLQDVLEPVAAFVTDPPYSSGSRTEAGRTSSGAMVTARRFAEPIELDQMTTPGFVWMMRAIATIARRLLEPGGSFCSFIDWRQWWNLLGAIETAGLRVNGMVVWDKGSPGTGHGFRSQHELMIHASNGVPFVADRSTGNVLGFPRVPRGSQLHAAQKPVELLEAILRVVVPRGGLVVDPFAGSGTTLVAAKSLGLRAIGFEIDRENFEIAADRLAGIIRARDDHMTGQRAFDLEIETKPKDQQPTNERGIFQ